MDDELEDINPSGQPRDGDDPAGNAPFGPNNNPIEPTDPEDGTDPGEEAARIYKQLEEIPLNPSPPPVNDADPEEGSDNENPSENEEIGTPAAANPSPANPPNLPEADAGVAGEDAKGFLPDFNDLDKTQAGMEDLGEKVEEWNESGGEDLDSIDLGSDQDGENAKESAQDFLSSNYELHKQSSDMWVDAARALDELRRRLELERL